MFEYILLSPLHVNEYINNGKAIAGFSELGFHVGRISSKYEITRAELVFIASDYEVEIDMSEYLVERTPRAGEYEHAYADINIEDLSTAGLDGEYRSANLLFYFGSNSVNIPVYISGFIAIELPEWEKEIEFSATPPIVYPNGKAVIDEIRVYQWDEGLNDWGTYDTYANEPVTVTEHDDSSWKFIYKFDKEHVDDKTSLNPNVKIEAHYDSSTSYEKEYREAFFSTTRNQNYSNGLYNIMFVSGVEGHPNFSSRVWWSKYNNPLYFPDTNYSEVGSNDTAIMGLTKVGDYLCAVKQSKTTDTAIYLLYPTSFEEDTTFAIKQGVQGVGALARYSFNILGDETLFLSPQGVMAIVPTEDNEHKVQNRSYFVDKRLLAEANIRSAFSFVFDGKYYLSMGDGAVYVLDGNQRNSWGNDRTNLVYECYYLENVPAQSFVKFHDALAFTDGNNVCIFGEGYEDAYDMYGSPKPVFAEWSTILDDDGSLHYYKTMQKKGNLISILPVENEMPYEAVTITEEEFNENKTLYFVFNGTKYVRCAETDTYDAGETYYVENRSATKVYVKKDDKDKVEIKRKFGLQSNIPSEMYLNKKFKKYKRLQFIIQNDADEDFGVDSIVKNYTVGNYAKK